MTNTTKSYDVSKVAKVCDLYNRIEKAKANGDITDAQYKILLDKWETLASVTL